MRQCDILGVLSLTTSVGGGIDKSQPNTGAVMVKSDGAIFVDPL